MVLLRLCRIVVLVGGMHPIPPLVVYTIPMLTDSAAIIERIAERLAKLDRVCCLTGAGVSAESGVPTFRGQAGLWQGQRPEDLATPEAFERDPEKVWKFYNYRREVLLDCRPNAAHRALVDLERVFDCWSLITQNVDRLHQRAGSRNPIELHGNIWTVRCTACGQEFDEFGVKLECLPTCESCGGLLRPAVVWFGEMLAPEVLAAAQMAMERCQAMLVIGTSSVVQPAASLALAARAGGALVVEINLETTPLSSQADECLSGKAGEILPRLTQAIKTRLSENLQ